MSNLEKEDELLKSPSFNSYSRAEIASKVVVASDDEDFEFSFNVSSGEFNGQIFPLFNRVGVPLRTLLRQEISLSHDHSGSNNNNSSSNINSDITDSCSSSEVDELEHIQTRTACCVWRCKKTGSSSALKRWASLRGLLKRTNSEGMKDNLVFLTQKKNGMAESKAKGTTKVIKVQRSSTSTHQDFYVRNKTLKEGDKKRSYLPAYRKDIVGFFLNVNVNVLY